MTYKRQDILHTASVLTGGDRNASYGDPHTNLTVLADLISAYLGVKLNSVDASVIMTLTKVSRIKVNQHHEDNYIDGAAYMAIAGECATKVSREKELAIEPACVV